MMICKLTKGSILLNKNTTDQAKSTHMCKISKLSFDRKTLRIVLTILCMYCFTINLQGQERDPSYAGGILVKEEAEIAYQNKSWEEASQLWAIVVNHNSTSPMAWTRLARSLRESHDFKSALEALHQEQKLGARSTGDIQLDIARCYAQLNKKKEAMKWLTHSYNSGMRHYKTVRNRDPAFENMRGDAEFQVLAGIIDPDTLSRNEGYRYDLAFFDKALRRIHYNFPDVSGDAVVTSFVQRFHDEIPTLNDEEILVRFMYLSTLAGDGHTLLYPDFVYSSDREGAEIYFYNYEEGLFINRVAPKYKKWLGSQVIKVGELPIKKVLDSLATIISRDNDIWVRQGTASLMPFPKILFGLGLLNTSDELPLTLVTPDGKHHNIKFASIKASPDESWVRLPGAEADSESPYRRRESSKNFWYKNLTKLDLTYMKFDRVRNMKEETISNFAKRMLSDMAEHDINRLVIDMRDNGGGNLIQAERLLQAISGHPTIDQLGHFFVIIGRHTFSAAMITAARFDTRTNALFVGEPTGSKPNFVGETVYIDLPYSGLRPSISNLYWQGTHSFDYRQWISPDLYAPPTYTDENSGIDPAFRAIREYLQAKDLKD